MLKEKKRLNNYHLWTALVTPFFENKKIDFDSLENLTNKQNKLENALLLIGSTGEGLSLSFKEKKQIISFLSRSKFNVPVMVGVSGFNIDEQIQWIRYCNDFEYISAFLLVVPIYAKPGPIGQTAWFETLLKESMKPCMLYNVPSRTGCKLQPEVLSNLKNYENLWALKEASGNIKDFLEFKKSNDQISLFCGNDDMMFELAKVGACGLVSVASNIWAEAVGYYVKKALLYDFDDETNRIWKKASDCLFEVINPIPVKCFLAQKKLIQTPTLRLPLIDTELKSFDNFHEANELVTQWMNKL